MASLFKTNEAKYHMWLLQIKQLNHFTLSAICENIGAMIIVEDEHAADEWRQRKRRKKNYLYSIHHGANTILVWWNDLNQAREKAKIWVEKTVHSENLIETHCNTIIIAMLFFLNFFLCCSLWWLLLLLMYFIVRWIDPIKTYKVLENSIYRRV